MNDTFFYGALYLCLFLLFPIFFIIFLVFWLSGKDIRDIEILHDEDVYEGNYPERIKRKKRKKRKHEK